MPALTIEHIGWVESVFKEKFGAPRQSGVVPSATGTLHFHPPYNQKDAFEGLEGFSHLWIISHFHQVPEETFRPKVRPPKLGGVKKVGVFSSRSPYRMNRLCLTVVKIERINIQNGTVSLEISGLDLIDGTPILDIKPYLPYADSHPEAMTSFGLPAQNTTPVVPENDKVYLNLTPEETQLITETLQAQPEPAYASIGQSFGLSLAGYNILWTKMEKEIIVTEVKKND